MAHRAMHSFVDGFVLLYCIHSAQTNLPQLLQKFWRLRTQLLVGSRVRAGQRFLVKLRGAGRVSAAGLFLHVLVVPVVVVDVVAVAVAVLAAGAGGTVAASAALLAAIS